MAISHLENGQKQFSLTADEFILMRNNAVGQDVSIMVDGNIPLQSVEGFTLLKRFVIDNSVRAVYCYLGPV